jgi:hypothetical protein
MQLISLERITKLGHLGEELAAERLKRHGFTEIENLNLRKNNYPFGNLLATKDGVRHFMGVKARNEMRQGDAGLNESYNLVLISDPINRKLKEQGKTPDQITDDIRSSTCAELIHLFTTTCVDASISRCCVQRRLRATGRLSDQVERNRVS